MENIITIYLESLNLTVGVNGKQVMLTKLIPPDEIRDAIQKLLTEKFPDPIEGMLKMKRDQTIGDIPALIDHRTICQEEDQQNTTNHMSTESSSI